MALLEASEEIAKAEKVEQNRQSLNDRMEGDYSLYRLDPFHMPPTEGKWDDTTANYARVMADYVIGTVAFGDRRIWIPIESQKKRERASLTESERLAIGVIDMAEQRLLSVPEEVAIQYALAWDGSVRGIQCLRYYMYKEDDEVIADLQVWDALFTSWISSHDGLEWVSYRKYMTEDALEKAYPEGSYDSPIANETGLICLRNIWDRDEEATCFGTGDWIRPPEKHGLDHVPVFIRPVGTQRYIHSLQFQDTIRDFGESVYPADRELLVKESRILTMYMTAAGLASKQPVNIAYDSAKGEKPEMTVSPNTAGIVNAWDKGKGQEPLPPTPQPSFEKVALAYQSIIENRNMGGIPPVAQGVVTGYLPAEGIALLTSSAQARVKPVLNTTQQSFEWLCREIISQYKDGDFPNLNVEGTDKGGHEFNTEIERSKVSQNRFKCAISTNLPTDTLRNVGVAVQLLKEGLVSPQTAMELTTVIKDPDGEMDRIEAYKVRQMMGVAEEEGLAALYKDDPELGRRVEARMQTQARQPGAANQPGIPQQPPMTAQVMGAVKRSQQIPVPPEIRQMIRSRMGE